MLSPRISYYIATNFFLFTETPGVWPVVRVGVGLLFFFLFLKTHKWRRNTSQASWLSHCHCVKTKWFEALTVYCGTKVQSRYDKEMLLACFPGWNEFRGHHQGLEDSEETDEKGIHLLGICCFPTDSFFYCFSCNDLFLVCSKTSLPDCQRHTVAVYITLSYSSMPILGAGKHFSQHSPGWFISSTIVS